MTSSTPAQLVYRAMTADYGTDLRDEKHSAPNMLEFNGLLHVDRVDEFVRAVVAWKRHVLSMRRKAAARATRKLADTQIEQQHKEYGCLPEAR